MRSPSRLGWFCSATLHVAILLILLLVTVRRWHRPPPRELFVARPEQAAPELVAFDISLPSLRFDESELLARISGGTRLSTIEVVPPAVTPVAGWVNDAPDAAVEKVDGRSGSAKKIAFFGAAAQGDRFVFVIDMSRSMGRSGRLQKAIHELQKAVGQLTEDQYFSVLLFSDKVRPMFEKNTGLIRATEANRARLAEWLGRVQPRGGTNPKEAIVQGLRMRPSAIFMLSDGAFESVEEAAGQPRVFKAEIAELIQAHNDGRTPIHTIAFSDPASKANMAEIAALTGGQFRFVSQRELASQVFYAEEIAILYWKRADEHIARGQLKQADDLYARILSKFPATKVADQIRRLRTVESSENGLQVGDSTPR